MSNKSKMEETLKNIPYAIKEGAKTQKGLRVSILNHIHRETKITKAEIFNFLKETEFKLERGDVK